MPEYRINTSIGGKPQFVRSRSFSHSHHHHMRDHFPHLHYGHSSDDLPHHHLVDHLLPHDHYYRVEYRRGDHHHHHHPRRPACPTNCACITRDEWANLLEQNRNYAALTKSLTADAAKLKKKADALAGDKAAAEKEAQRLACSNAELSAALKKLQDENAELRRCLTSQKKDDCDLVESLRLRIRNLLAELDGKDSVIKSLESRVCALKKELHDLKHRYKHRHSHGHKHHRGHGGPCGCHSCGRKKAGGKDDDGSSSSSSSDSDSGGRSSRGILRKRLAEMSVSLALWQRKAEYAEKRALELQRDCDAARAEVARQTDLADRFRSRIRRLEDRLGCRERGVWFS
ncbi:hypothetical protein Micbo1qcDRAFT_229302 [Microdochium bolleyi]|uniref:Uncharacterized protein n=1 Tax=Microdochium bolleyi TaxID=196109 RepID=A0A136JGU9_9PEZI|nr:hypothetical protein Micbo1qcDRAFT_229302 [Microdochium bolleyi]